MFIFPETLLLLGRTGTDARVQLSIAEERDRRRAVQVAGH